MMAFEPQATVLDANTPAKIDLFRSSAGKVQREREIDWRALF